MNPIRAHGPARTCRVATRGFSLIEVLIAVLVLGVGLLGLASVFPVVITQQRDASDVIRGGAASTAIRAQIRANPDIIGELLSQDGYADADELDQDGDRSPNEVPGDGADTNPDIADGQEPIFGMDPGFSAFGAGELNPGGPDGTGRSSPLTGFSYLWEADWNWSLEADEGSGDRRAIGIGAGLLVAYREDGGVRFRDPVERALAGVNNDQPDLPVTARLYPRPYSATGGGSSDGPQFVWDFVPRRMPSGDVQVVVFVRRISTGIRVGSGRTLSDVLSDTTNRVFPVSRDPDTGLVTTDGSGEYAVPLSAVAEPIPLDDYLARPEARASFDPGNDVLRDGVRVRTSGGQPQVGTGTRFEDIEPIAAVGQRFVDNLGVVRTVVEVLSAEPGADFIDVRVEPEFVRNAVFPTFVDAQQQANGVFALNEAARIGKLRQIVYTPQVPIDVVTMEVRQ